MLDIIRGAGFTLRFTPRDMGVMYLLGTQYNEKIVSVNGGPYTETEALSVHGRKGDVILKLETGFLGYVAIQYSWGLEGWINNAPAIGFGGYNDGAGSTIIEFINNEEDKMRTYDATIIQTSTGEILKRDFTNGETFAAFAGSLPDQTIIVRATVRGAPEGFPIYETTFNA